MAISYEIDGLRQRVTMVLEGDLALEDAARVAAAILSDPRLGPEFTVLSDHRNVNRPMSSADLGRATDLLEAHRERLHGVRWAAVATRPLVFGVLRMLAAQIQLQVGIEMKIFTDGEEAELWLQRPEHPD